MNHTIPRTPDTLQRMLRRSGAVLAACLLLSASGCQKTPVNGDLDGQWRVLSVTVNGEELPMPAPAYWAVSLHVIQFVYDNHLRGTAKLHYDRDGRSLAIDMPPSIYHDHRPTLTLCGVRNPQAVYTVEQLDSRRMTLTEGDERITFEKF